MQQELLFKGVDITASDNMDFEELLNVLNAQDKEDRPQSGEDFFQSLGGIF
jgi:hypothetical protein